ncbi:MAG TPA: hypothetical protein EYH56_02345 [Nanoarchaeota archaeon]|nr:hypothetical protein [Aigarchaeota archaeon]HIQ50014.1 hypothetical protein [Nanoarchaeota archaeon]
MVEERFNTNNTEDFKLIVIREAIHENSSFACATSGGSHCYPKCPYKILNIDQVDNVEKNVMVEKRL